MKKRKIFMILGIIVMSTIWILCMHFFTIQYILKIENRKSTDMILESSIVISDTNTLYFKNFGSYIVSNNWIESKTHSTNNKFFYIANEMEEGKERPNNISINIETNKYSYQEHEKFRTAILNQLSRQISASPNYTINANGSYTKDNNYIVYEFDIYEKDENITTKQFYIIGDYKHVLIHETIYDSLNNNEIDIVAKKIVDSFKWNSEN